LIEISKDLLCYWLLGCQLFEISFGDEAQKATAAHAAASKE
jgi:hypothetical protein